MKNNLFPDTVREKKPLVSRYAAGASRDILIGGLEGLDAAMRSPQTSLVETLRQWKLKDPRTLQNTKFASSTFSN